MKSPHHQTNIPSMFHPGVSRSPERVDAGLIGWMAHQFELLADGHVWDDLTRRSQGNDFTRHLDGGPSIFCSKVNPESGAAGFTVPAQTEKQRESKQQIVYSKAGAR